MIPDETRRKLKILIKDKEFATPIKGVKITIIFEDKTEVEDKVSDENGKYISSKANFHVGSKVEIKLTKESYEEFTMEVKVGDGVEGVFEMKIDFNKVR